MPVTFFRKLLKKYRGKLERIINKKKKLYPFFLGVLLVAIPVSYFIYRNLTKVQAVWLTGGWNYRRLLEISNTSGGDLTDYQTEISVDTASLINAGKMNADCSDIRFTSTDNTIYSYWLDKDCNTSDTRFWVKLPSIPTTGTAIYMYYGNVNAASASNGTDTFVFFDNFDDNDYSANWETHDRSYTSTANSIATEETGGQQKISGTTVSGTDRGNGLRTGATFPTPIVFEADRVSFSGTGTRALGFIHMYTSDTNWVSYGGGIGYNGAANRHARISYINGSRTTTEAISSTDDYGNHRFGIKHDGTNAVFYVDGTQMATLAASQLTSVKVGTSSWVRALTDTIDVRFDNARVRKYASAEPTISTKEEETSDEAPVAQWRFDEGYSADELQPQTKLEQQITILDREYGCKGCTDLPTDNSLGIVKWDSSKYPDSTLYFEAVMKTGGGASVTAELFTTAGVAVTNALVTSGSWDTSYTRYRSSSPITLVDGEEYTVRFTSGNGAVANSRINTAKIIVIQENPDDLLTGTQTQIELGDVETQLLSSYTAIDYPKIYYYDESKFTPAPATYFEATIKGSTNPTIEQQINITNKTFTATGSTYPSTPDFSTGFIHWDADKYPGATVYLEAVTQTNGWYARYRLIDSSGNEATGSDSGNLGGSLRRSRSGPITLTDDTDYTIQVRNSSIYTTTLYAAKLVIIQTGETSITTTTTAIELGSHQTGFTNTTNAALTAPKFYLYDQNQFSPTPESSADVRFEASLKIDDAGDTAHAVLINKTSGATVAEVARTGSTTWGRVETTNVDGDADWDTSNDDEYEVQIRCTDGNGGGCSGSIANAHVLLDQYSASGITDLEVVHPQVITTVTQTGTSFVTKGYYSGINPEYNSDFATSFGSATLNYFYEADIMTTSGTAYAHLYNIERQGSIVTNIPMDGGQVTSTSTSFERKRSPDITNQFTWPVWDEAMTMDTALKTSASSGVTASVSNSALVIQVSNLSTSGPPTAYVDLYNITDGQTVTGSEISTTSKQWDLVRSNQISLTTGKEYYVRSRSSVNGAPIYLANAKIIHDQQDPAGTYQTEVIHDMANALTGNNNSTYASINYPLYVTTNNFDHLSNFNEVPMYFEATMRTTSGTGYAQMYDTAAISGSEITTTNTAYQRVRSATDLAPYLSAAGANNYTQLRHSSTGSNATLVTNSRLLYQNKSIITNVTHDSMPLQAHGSINGASWKDLTECKSSNCLDFDGIDDYVKVAAGRITEFGSSDSFSISIWFRTGEATGTLYAKYNSATGTDGGLKIYLQNGKVVGAIDDDVTWDPDDSVTSSGLYNDNNWHEALFVKSKNDFIKLYVDGELEATDNFLTATGTLSNTDSTYFGIDGDGTTAPFNGSLDTVSIYRHAKNETEAVENYNNGNRGITLGDPNNGRLTSNMKLFWKFDESTANTCDTTNDACDSSGNNIHGSWEGNASASAGKYGNGISLDGTGDYVLTEDTQLISNTYWADLDYGTRKIFLVSNTNGSALTNFPVQITIDYTVGMQPDFDDLMFTNKRGQVLPYWIETKTDSVSATVWVKMDNIPTIGTAFYMYYGNANATSSSNGTNVFQLFDDFSQDIGYTEVGPGNSTYSISDGIMTITETLDGRGMDSGYNIGTNFAVVSGTQQVRASINPSVLKELHGAYFCGDVVGYNTSGRFYKFAGTQSYGNVAEQVYSGSGLQTVYANLDDFTCTGDVSVMQDDDATNAAEIQLDYFLIRPLATTEPTVTILGSENRNSVIRPTLTVSAWVYPENIDSTTQTLLTRGSAPTYDWLLALSPSSPGSILFANGNGTNQRVSTNALVENTWNHVVMVMEATKTKLFINGNYDSQILNSGTVFGVNSISAGAMSDGSNAFDGRLDDIRIYNSSLSLSEIRQLYQYTPGPVAYWKLDENNGTAAYDASGNGNNSTTWTGNTSWATGIFGSALSFDGNDDVVRFAETEFTDLGDITDSYTVEAWFNTKASYGSNGIIMCKNANDATYPYCLYLASGTNQVVFRFYGGGAGSVVSPSAYNDGNWHHVAGVRDAYNDMVYLYVDGILVAEATDESTTAVSNDSDVSIGNAWDSYTNRDFNGLVDDVKIYDYARTPSQITIDMNAEHPIPGSPIGSALAEWEFDEGYGDTANNSSREETTLNGNLAGTDSCPGDSNCPTWTTSGKFGRALYFDGDDYIDLGSASELKKSRDFTVSAWVNINNTTGTIITHGHQDWQLRINGQKVELLDANTASVLTSTTNLTNNQWHFVAVTISSDSTADVKIYLDGKLDGSTTTTADLSNGTYSATIGTKVNVSSMSEYFTGYLDSISFYNVELTEAQIGTLYNQGYVTQFGATGTTSAGSPDQSASREYCIPGDSSYCAGPIAHWKMDENDGQYIYDTSGNNLSGTRGANNSVSTTDPTWTSGKRGSGLDFDGINDYTRVSDNDLLTPANSMTFSAWIKMDVLPSVSGRPYYIFAKNNSTSLYQSYYCVVANPTNQLTCYWINNTENSYADSYTSFTLQANTWYYVTFVMDGSYTRLYVNGIPDVAHSSVTGTTKNSNTYLDFGGNVGSNSSWFDGQMDDFKLFDYARSPAQIAWDYNRGDPVVHYKFDECSGTTAYNSVKNANGEAAGLNGNITITSGGGGTQDSAGSCSSGVDTEAWNNGTTGAINAAMSFDGLNDYAATSSTIDLTGTDKITVSFWLNWDTYTNNDDLALESSTNFNNGNPGAILIDPNAASGNFEIAFQRSSLGGNYRLESFTRPSAGDWHHYILVFDNSGTSGEITVYLDGVNIPTTVVINDGKNTDNGFGNYTWYFMSRAGASLFGEGKMDDFRIYNYAVTPAQASMIYNNNAAVSFE